MEYTVQSITAGQQDNRPTIDWTPEQIQLLKDTVARGATDDEFKMFLYVCSRTGLDPFLRQIHMVKRWDSNMKREVATIQTGIDGYRVIADRSGSYAGVDEPRFTFAEGETKYPLNATVTVYRIVSGQRVGFTATAFFDEYKQVTRDGNLTRFWERMPKSQLAKCAEALALRKAFPNDLSGLYTNEEMEQAGETAAKPATPKQIAYIESLVKGSNVPEEIQNEVLSWLDAPEKTADVASTWIDNLLVFNPRPERNKAEADNTNQETAPAETQEPVKPARAATGHLIGDIELLEEELLDGSPESELTVKKLRQKYAGSTDLGKATPLGLTNYQQQLRNRIGH